MKIIFILPGLTNKPTGGHKIVYEYANRLAMRGHDVAIAYDVSMVGKKIYIPICLQPIIRHLISYTRLALYPRWFNLNKKIKKKAFYNLDDSIVIGYDIVVATALSTAEPVDKLNDIKKVYFIQGFETWEVEKKAQVFDTYKLGMMNITISSWLKSIVDAACDNKKCVLIPNGIDDNIFFIKKAIERRNPYSISMLYHSAPYKGCKNGIEALCKLKAKYPQLVANVFGVEKRPYNLPLWINYHKNISQEKLCNLYNESAIFLSTSVSEGFGLTPAESMACGCAVVSTNYGGINEYAKNEYNSLLSEIGNSEKLYSNMCRLIEDNILRIKLAKAGYISIKKLKWISSVDKFERTLKQLLEDDLDG